MAGAYQLTLSRTTITEVRDGEPTGQVWRSATVTIRDGMARVKVAGVEVASMPASTFTRNSSRSWTIPGDEGAGDEGTNWQVAKSCGCGG